MSQTYVHMGSLGRPHGISGEIFLDWYGASPLSKEMQLYLQSNTEEPAPIQIEQVRTHNGRLLLRIVAVTSREEAALLRGKKLLILRSTLPRLNAEEAYISDLINASVFLPNGTCLGYFSHVLQGTSGSVWSIRTKDNKEILFPAQPAFIHSFDVENQRIIIEPPEGLLDLYK